MKLMKCNIEVLTRKMQRTHVETLCIPARILTVSNSKDVLDTVMATSSKTNYADD
jgi:hypothetical protein